MTFLLSIRTRSLKAVVHPILTGRNTRPVAKRFDKGAGIVEAEHIADFLHLQCRVVDVVQGQLPPGIVQQLTSARWGRGNGPRQIGTPARGY